MPTMRFKLATAIVLALLVAASPAAAGILTSHIATDAEMLSKITAIAFVAEGRGGDGGGAATFELDLGEDTGNPAVTEQYAWTSGAVEPFTLSYDSGTNTVTFSLGGETLQFQPIITFAEIFVRTRAVNANSSITVDNLFLNGMPVNDQSTCAGPGGLDILAISGEPLMTGFTMTGDATMTWTGSLPSQSRLAFQIKVGNAPTVPTEQRTLGKIKSIYR